jgi:hypothetical protein
MGDTENKKCFVVTPIGSANSEVRRSAEGVIDTVIQPVLEKLGFQVDVAHRMYNTGSINKQILSRILNDDLVVVNLTGLNPNVMYELAVRHASRKPVVQICEKDTKLPFDITEERTIFFTNDMAGVVELTDSFIKTVESAMNEQEPDNPIYRVIETSTVLKQVSVKDPETYVLQRLDSFEDRLMSTINKLNRVSRNEYIPGNELRDSYEIKTSYLIKLMDPDYDYNEAIKILNEYLPEIDEFTIRLPIPSIDKDADFVLTILPRKRVKLNYIKDLLETNSNGKIKVIGMRRD